MNTERVTPQVVKVTTNTGVEVYVSTNSEKVAERQAASLGRDLSIRYREPIVRRQTELGIGLFALGHAALIHLTGTNHLDS